RMFLQRWVGYTFREQTKRREGASGDPLVPCFGDHGRCAIEVSSVKQVRQRYLPLSALEKVVGDPVSFFGNACLAHIRSKTTDKKVAEERMESIFLAGLTITRNGKKHV